MYTISFLFLSVHLEEKIQNIADTDTRLLLPCWTI